MALQRGRTVPKPLKDYPLTNGSGVFVPGSNAFGFRLLGELSQRNKTENLFLSPLSISLAFGMVVEGTGGVTRAELLKAMSMSGQTAAGAFETEVRNLLVRYHERQLSPEVQANIASALWPNSALPPTMGHLSPDYAARVERAFDATATPVNFADASGAQKVNAWTSEHTKGKIPTILPPGPLGRDVALVLTNAIYFKAKWNVPFEKGDTENGPFTLPTGATRTVPRMKRTADMEYQKGNGWSAVQLPYDEGRFSFIVVLPDRQGASGVADLNAFTARNLSSVAQWNGYLSRFSREKVALELPRFRVAYDAGDLIPPLKSLGMRMAFDPRCRDFAPMGFPQAYISLVKHKTTLAVDEEGTEATAVTGIGMRATAAVIQPKLPIPFVVDRPFFCAIRDNAAGALVFLGRITNPQA